MRSLLALLIVGAGGCWWTDNGAFDLYQAPDLAPSVYACPALASYCVANNAHWCTFDLADVRSNVCLPDGGIDPNKGAVYAGLADCGSYLQLVVGYADTGQELYYDAATHAIVAALFHNYDGKTSCSGGPPTFVVPSCGAPRSPCN